MLPRRLRSVDALHLATALELGADLDAVVAYDSRLIEGARSAGLSVVTPA
jgi:predicted nucleic acid-binding protein